MNFNNLLMDSWLRHAAEVMRLGADALPGGDIKRALTDWAKEIDWAADMIKRHNQDVLSRCENKQACGRTPDMRRCPTCPAEFVIEWPSVPIHVEQKR